MNNISVKTIKEFLHQQGYTWKGEVSVCGNPTHPATPFDNNNHNVTNFVLYNPKPYNQHILVNLCKFYFCKPLDDEINSFKEKNFTSTLDLSHEWQKFLFEKYGEHYQNELINLANHNINSLLKDLHNNLKMLKEQHKTTFNGVYNEINFWKGIKSNAEHLNNIVQK